MLISLRHPDFDSDLDCRSTRSNPSICYVTRWSAHGQFQDAKYRASIAQIEICSIFFALLQSFAASEIRVVQGRKWLLFGVTRVVSSIFLSDSVEVTTQQVHAAFCSKSSEIGRTIQTLWRAFPRILLHFFIHIPNMHETYQKKYRILPTFLPPLSAYAYWLYKIWLRWWTVSHKSHFRSNIVPSPFSHQYWVIRSNIPRPAYQPIYPGGNQWHNHLAVLRNTSGSATDILRKKVTLEFQRHDLKITIDDGNLQVVNFLHITMNLQTGQYKPYRKPRDTPPYLNALFNHPRTWVCVHACAWVCVCARARAPACEWMWVCARMCVNVRVHALECVRARAGRTHSCAFVQQLPNIFIVFYPVFSFMSFSPPSGRDMEWQVVDALPLVILRDVCVCVCARKCMSARMMCPGACMHSCAHALVKVCVCVYVCVCMCVCVCMITILHVHQSERMCVPVCGVQADKCTYFIMIIKKDRELVL